MTEIEKIGYAKSFIDKLAVGVDPTSGVLISEWEVLANPRISKCLLYVSGLLNKMIQNPALVEQMDQKSAWKINESVLACISCTENSVSLREMAKRINAALNSSRRFTAAPINAWLLKQGYLELHETGKGGRRKCPTPKGEKLGIFEEEYLDFYGKLRKSVRCNVQAQQFIRAHLAEILALNGKSTLD